MNVLKHSFENKNSEEEDMFIIATGRYLIKRKQYKEYKNSGQSRSSHNTYFEEHLQPITLEEKSDEMGIFKRKCNLKTLLKNGFKGRRHAYNCHEHTFDKKKQYKKYKTSIKRSTWTNSSYSRRCSYKKFLRMTE